MRHSIPANLKVLNRSDSCSSNAVPSFKINGGVFDITRKKACFPNYAQKLKLDLIMTTLKRHFSCPILSLLNFMSKPFNLKCAILYFLPIQSCSRSGTVQIICALFAKRNQKLLNISFPLSLFEFILEMCWIILFVPRKQLVQLTLKEIWMGILISECPLLNYLQLIWKI